MSVHATTQTPASSAQPAYDSAYDDDRGYGWVVFAGYGKKISSLQL